VTERAKKLLLEGGYTCVFMSADQTLTSKKRGVAPLLEIIDGKQDLRGSCAADKVVGAGAAYLYVLLGVKEIWAHTISEAARAVLERYDIPYSYGNCVPHIVNRTGDGICPMENAVRDATSPEDALQKIRKTLEWINKA